MEELFPTLGDNVPSSNPLAVLLNSIGTSDERGVPTTSLFNPFNLSPPRLHEFHAIATANLISQTQEAIMQEYNISDFDFDKQEPALHEAATEQEPGRENHLPTLRRRETGIHSKEGTIDLSTNNCADTSHETVNNSLSWKLNDTAYNLSLSKKNEQEIAAAVSHIFQPDENEKLNDKSLKAIFNSKHNCELSDTSEVRTSLCDKVTLKIPNLLTVSKRKLDCVAGESTCKKNKGSHLENHALHKESVPVKEAEKKYDTCQGMFSANLQQLVEQQKKYLENLKADLTDVNHTDSVGHGLRVKHNENENAVLKTLKTPQQQCVPNDVDQTSKVLSSAPNPTSLLFVCHICYKQFLSGENLDLHCQNHQKYVCAEKDCVRTFVSRSHLQYHMQAHG